MSKKKWSFYYKLIPYKELSNIQIIEADSKRIVEIREKKNDFFKIYNVNVLCMKMIMN